MLVFAIKQRERDHFIHGHDARIAEGNGEQGAELVESRFESATGLADVVHDDRGAVPGHEVVVGPLAVLERSLRFARDGACRSIRLLREHLHLHASGGFRCQPARDDKLGAIRECGGDPDFEDGGHLGLQVGRLGLIRPLLGKTRRQRRIEREVLFQELPHLGREFRRWVLAPLRNGCGQVGRATHRNRLAEKMPRSMRIACEDVWRHVLCEVPRLGAVAERQIDGSEVADVAAILRADDQSDDLSGIDAQVLERAEFENLFSLRFAFREDFADGAATHFECPGDAVAAFGIRVADIAVNTQRAGLFAAPGDDRGARGRRMRGDAVGLHLARGQHGGVG